MSALYVVFEVDGRLAAFDAADVQSVIEIEDIYPVPQSPAWVAGLTAMRSQSLTVIDCRLALELPAAETPGERPVDAVVMRLDRRALRTAVRAEAAGHDGGRTR